jgi:multidrug efflux pump subunit AcrA (membrane-fusion protein)
MKVEILLLLTLLCVCGCSKKQGDMPDAKGSSKQGGSGGSASSGSGGSGEGKQGQAEPGTVRIEAANQPKAGIVIAQVEARTLPQVLTVPAQVEMDDAHTSHIGAIASGRVTAVYVLSGQNVRRGMVLAQFHSDSVHETVGALAKAFADADRQRSAVAFAQQAADRYAKLYAIQAASLEEKQRAEQELKQAQQALTDALADVQSL